MAKEQNRPFGHNRHGPKSGAALPLSVGGKLSDYKWLNNTCCEASDLQSSSASAAYELLMHQ